MKIVFNTDQIHLHGGIEKVMATKANHFASLPGFEVIILTTEQEGKVPCYPLDPRIKIIDLSVNYDRSKSYLSLKNLIKVVTHFFEQRKMLNNLQPDIIISANFNFDHYWLPFIKPIKTKVIKEIHGSGYASPAQRQYANFLNHLKWKLNDYIMGKYDSIVVLNADEKNYLTTNNVAVIPNPIEIPEMQATLENKQVLAAGRIAPIKGFDQLINAWQLVHQKHPDWKLHLYGDDYSNTKVLLQKQIKGYHLEEVISFIDSVDNLPQTMLEYSIYAMSSVSECFPMVLLEAFSVGLPVVSYDCPNGPRNIISHQSDGLLIADQNPEALSKGLIQLIENEALRKTMGATAKINSKRFKTNDVMKQWLNLFHNLNETEA